MNNQAHILYQEGEHDIPIELMRDCVHQRKLALGTDHPDTQVSTESLSNWLEEDEEDTLEEDEEDVMQV